MKTGRFKYDLPSCDLGLLLVSHTGWRPGDISKGFLRKERQPLHLVRLHIFVPLYSPDVKCESALVSFMALTWYFLATDLKDISSYKLLGGKLSKTLFEKKTWAKELCQETWKGKQAPKGSFSPFLGKINSPSGSLLLSVWPAIWLLSGDCELTSEQWLALLCICQVHGHVWWTLWLLLSCRLPTHADPEPSP